MHPRPLLTAIGIVAVLLSARAAPGAPLASGAETGAWMVASDGRGGALVYFLPVGARDGVVRVAAAFPTDPLAIAGDADAAVLIFPPHTAESADHELLPVRRVERDNATATGSPFSHPHALAPLPAGARVLDLALIGDVPLVLRDAGSPDAPKLELLKLHDNAWTPLPLPKSIDPGSRIWLASVGERPALIQQPEPGTVVLWSRSPDPEGWTERRLDTERRLREAFGAPSGLRAVAREGNSLALLAPRDARLVPVASVSNVTDGGAVAPWGADLAIVWRATRVESGLVVRLISPDGTTLYDGPVTVAGPVSPAEVQILIVLLSSVFLTAIVFVLRPELRAASPLNFPPGASLASPARRFLAFAIDLIPGLGVAYVGWFAGAHTLADVAGVLSERGAAPILAAAGVTIVLTTIGEATTGRTLGKALLRCRTISYTGERPLWRQALARNAVKVLCPPIGLFVLLAPASPHPGSFDTLVIVDHQGRRNVPPDASDRSDRA